MRGPKGGRDEWLAQGFIAAATLVLCLAACAADTLTRPVFAGRPLPQAGEGSGAFFIKVAASSPQNFSATPARTECSSKPEDTLVFPRSNVWSPKFE
jgi:hypothetical protein